MANAAAKPKSQPRSSGRTRLLEIIKQKSLLVGGEFKLASGATSKYYLDMKPTMFDPEGAYLIAEIICKMVASDDEVAAVGGLELGAVPVVAACCAVSWPGRPLQGFVVRKERKGHGTDKKIDGNFKSGMNVILLEDVTTSGGSVMQAVHAVRSQGGTVSRVITIVDRQEGARENLRNEGIELSAIFTKDELLLPD
jgi:orotate phosphoribosyltransferase